MEVGHTEISLNSPSRHGVCIPKAVSIVPVTGWDKGSASQPERSRRMTSHNVILATFIIYLLFTNFIKRSLVEMRAQCQHRGSGGSVTMNSVCPQS